jgi:hypothetical protein
MQTIRCSLRNCNTCKYNVSGHGFNCELGCAIYMIECSFCHKKYVGNTKRILRTRIREHMQDIDQAKPTTLVAKHFSKVCSMEHFTFKVIEYDIKDQYERLKREVEEIMVHDSAIPNGLNLRVPMLSHVPERISNSRKNDDIKLQEEIQHHLEDDQEEHKQHSPTFQLRTRSDKDYFSKIIMLFLIVNLLLICLLIIKY